MDNIVDVADETRCFPIDFIQLDTRPKEISGIQFLFGNIIYVWVEMKFDLSRKVICLWALLQKWCRIAFTSSQAIKPLSWLMENVYHTCIFFIYLIFLVPVRMWRHVLIDPSFTYSTANSLLSLAMQAGLRTRYITFSLVKTIFILFYFLKKAMPTWEDLWFVSQ